MKRFLYTILILFFASTFTTRAQTDTSRTKKDSIPGLLIFKEAIRVEGAKATFTKETKELDMSTDLSMSADRKAGDSATTKKTNFTVPQGLMQAPLSAAGPTAGQLDVSSTGGAVYSVPISLPPGIGGVVPQISLAYNSQSGNGVVGLGWSIGGLSAITRIPSTKFHDNKITAVNFNTDDRFALDGQRLLLKSGTYGADGSEYQTENYSNLKIVSRGTSPFGSSHGPAYFEVFYPDGSKAVYGETVGSRTTTSFALTYTENPIGARINYTYSVSDHTFIVTEIAYGNIGTSQTLNKINFHYSEINRAEMGYTGGDRLYRKSLLNKISVTANGTAYRNYVLTLENIPTLNYKRVTQIAEYNGNQTLFRSPLIFNYQATSNTIAVSTLTRVGWTGLATNNSEVVTADYTGDGKLDFILRPNTGSNIYMYHNLVQGGSSNFTNGVTVPIGAHIDIFTGGILTEDSKLLPRQGISVVKNNSSYDAFQFEQRMYIPEAPMALQYQKEWGRPRGPSYFSECEQQTLPGQILNFEFLSGDFNGDGLLDVLAVNFGDKIIVGQHMEWLDDPQNPQESGSFCVNDYGFAESSAYFINLDRRISSNFVLNLGVLSQRYVGGDKLYTGDFNGDGRTDLVHVKNGVLFVYTINAETSALEPLWQTSSGYIDINEQLLLGDYNGDGKTDVMFTTAGFNNTFAIGLSTGRNFNIQVQNYPFKKEEPKILGTYFRHGYLIPTDINNDGKTDIIEVYNNTQDSGGYSEIKVHHNMGTSPAYEQHFAYGGSGTVWSGTHRPIPLFLNSDKQNPNLEFGLLSHDALKLVKFEKDFKSEGQLASITQDGIVHNIAYKTLGLTDDYDDEELPYETSYEQTYPYVNLHNLSGLNVVDKLTRTHNSQQLQQLFGYGKGVSNMEGLGFLGFGQTIRSTWHVDEYDTNRMFNINLTNPLLRGATKQILTTRSSVVPSASSTAVAMPDITLSTPVPSAQTTEASNTITLTDGFIANGDNGVFVGQITNSATGVNDGASIYSYITRTDYTYNTQLLANKVFVNIPTSVATKDLLNGTNTLQLHEYDNYYNITKTTTNLSGAGTKSEEITYDNNLSGYYVGRPLTRRTTMTAAGDTHSSEEEFTYTGFLPTQIKKKGHGTPWITENLNYDAFGNITQKTISTANGSRTTSATYDGTGRFALQQTDIEGLTSTATYDAATGNLLTRTNPYGQTTTNVFDTWGRLTETTDHLGKKSYSTYDKDANGYVFAQTDDEGREKTTYTNALGQTIQATEKTVTGSIVGSATEYDVYGRAYRQSQPAAPGSYSQWNETEFDEYGRVKKATAYTGKVTNMSYSGLSTTVNDGTKSTTTTKNVLGQTIIQQDPGGSINFSYYAHGGLKAANYDGSVQTLEYDGWGRKTKLVDPSAGQYTYTYNAFGEITQETTPKGVTNYAFDNITGKLTSKTLTGDDTGLGYTYSYDNTTKLLNSLSFTNVDGNNATYTYTYDNSKRLVSTLENNLHAQFTKSYTYDDFDRVATETYQAKDKASNTIATRIVEYTYQNGELLQAVDQATGKILSKVNTLKSNGQLATELQGSSLKTTYNYDSFNLPQSTVTERIGNNPATLMNLGYSFDALRGNLNNRTNSAVSWNESFTYDIQDRLTNFNDNNGNNSQAYDARGRITNNSQLGNYGYSGTSYQQSELTNPTPAATTWYQDRGLQQLTFNAFKKPVNINEQGKEQIDFQYNASLQRAHMYYGSTDADKALRPMRRHYSEDGGMEITRNIVTGETDFVFYLGGDAYDAPAIYKEVHNNIGATQNLYYLQRDHLGSIVLITNVDGNPVEKRQFDAWGNIAALTDGNGNPLTAFVITDRGYTGHEHLLNVGLINMNGRLYDPKLHRFLSPDNFVQDPTSTQNFNRYGYAMNNPFMYTDPSGEVLWFVPILVGAGISILTNGIDNAINHKPFFQGAFKAGVIGGLSGLASFGIGEVAQGLSGFSKVSFQTFAHAYLGGVSSFASGGDFISGLASGALGSLAATGMGSLLNGANNFWEATGTIASGSLMGGVSAELSGSNFWDGVRNGAISSGLNHVAHVLQNRLELEAYARKQFGKDFKSVYGVKSLRWGSQLGNEIDGLTYNRKDQMIYDQGEAVGGITTVDRRIYISDAAKYFGEKAFLKLNIGHELIHSYQRMTLGSNYIRSYSEHAAYQYSIDFAKRNSYQQTSIKFYVSQQKLFKYNAGYNYKLIPGFK
jgi:RHS repeat-associated protein